MSTRHGIPATSTTVAEREMKISVRGPGGVFKVQFSAQDTVSDLKARIESSQGYPARIQRFSLHSGIPADPTQAVADNRLVADFVSRGSLRLEVEQSHGGVAAPKASSRGENGVSRGNNSIGELEMEDESSAGVGNRYASLSMAEAFKNTPGAVNNVGKARVKGSANLTVGDQYGY